MNLMMDMEKINRLDKRFYVSGDLKLIGRTVESERIDFDNNVKKKIIEYDGLGRPSKIKSSIYSSNEDSTAMYDSEITYLSNFKIGKVKTIKYYNSVIVQSTEELITYSKNLNGKIIEVQTTICEYDNNGVFLRDMVTNNRIEVKKDSIISYIKTGDEEWTKSVTQKLDENTGAVIEEENDIAKITIVVK